MCSTSTAAQGAKSFLPTAYSICFMSDTSAILQAARAEGDILIVGINSDASTRQLKGEGRPVLTERARATLVAALGGRRLRGNFRRTRRESRFCAKSSRTCTPKEPITRRKRFPKATSRALLGIRIAIVGDPKDHSTRDFLARLRRQGDA